MIYTYTWYQWLAFFYFYCFFGWVFESAYVSLKKRHPVNRGFLRLPLLPLYGSGAVMMLWVSLPFRSNLLLVYLSGVLGATVLEYVTGGIMEQLFKVRYWDYSNQRFQLHGYICLTSSIAWGFLTILMTEVIHEPVARLILGLNQQMTLLCTVIISILFITDVYESTRAALALGKSLEAMTRLKADIEEIQTRITTLKEEAADHILLGITAIREHHQNSELPHLIKRLEDARERHSAILHRKGMHRFYRKGLLLGNPGAVSLKFTAALKEMREELEQHINK